MNNILELSFDLIKLRLKVLEKTLEIKSLNQDIRDLVNYDTELSLLVKSILKYDFRKQVSLGSTLFVGEGNMSFANCIIEHNAAIKTIVTVFEKEKDLTSQTKSNADELYRKGAKVFYEIDATNLIEYFSNDKFHTIIFQFPNTGSREAINGCNSNFVLVRDFLKSAKNCILEGGKIVITYVDNEYYNGIFKFEKLAESLGLKYVQKYLFNPKDFPSYQHTMTHQEGSALENHNQFATIVFSL